jgi:hypothetical protein
MMAEIILKKIINDFYQLIISVVENDLEMLKLNPKIILSIK